MHLCEHSFVQRSVYHLKAFVCHLGDTMKSGHYIAYVTDSTSWMITRYSMCTLQLLGKICSILVLVIFILLGS